MAVRKKTA